MIAESTPKPFVENVPGRFYVMDSCNGCGLCFYACPEPGAIAVYKRPAAVRAA